MTKEKIFTVYILRTSGNTLYTGQTNDIERRMIEHRSKSVRSAKYVRRYESFELVYIEKHNSRAEAMAREAAIKRLSKLEKENLVKGKG